MSDRLNTRAFEGLHPAFAALYFVAALVLSMVAIHPIIVLVAALSGIAYGVYLKGASSLRSLLWQLPMLALIAVVNPLFSITGSTELFRIGVCPFYLESLAYGACMGALLIAVMQWFSNAAQILTSDKVMLLLGRAFPLVSLLVSMTLRLVPHFARRGASISQAMQANTAASQDGNAKADRLRQVTVLMGWGMEDSLDMADAMRARGWGAAGQRTSYSRWEFRLYDGVACAVLVALIVLCAFAAAFACGAFSFYPVMGTWVSWWCYAPIVCFYFLPFALEGLLP